MIQIVFSNTFKAPKNTRPMKVFRAVSYELRDNCIYGEFPNGKIEPVALGNGNLWHVGDSFYNRVQFLRSNASVGEKEEKVA